MLKLGNGPGIVALPNRGLTTVPRRRRIIAGRGTQRATLPPASPAEWGDRPAGDVARRRQSIRSHDIKPRSIGRD
jgi:hypothetical protein